MTDAYIAIWSCVYALTCMSYMFPFVNWIVNEKEKKLKDFLMHQGINRISYDLSWFITYLILIFIPVKVSTAIFKLLFMTNVNTILIFAAQFLFTINMFGMCYLFETFVQTINSGQMIIKLIYILYFLLRRPEVNVIVKYFLCPFPQFPEVINFELFLLLNNFPNGCDWKLMNTAYNNMTLLSTFIILIVDLILYVLLAYFINVYSQSGLI